MLPNALFKWRVRGDGVTGDALPASQSTHLRLVFLPVQRVLSSDGSGREGGRLKPLQSFLSLLHVKVQGSPRFVVTFNFGPWTFNFGFAPDF